MHPAHPVTIAIVTTDATASQQSIRTRSKRATFISSNRSKPTFMPISHFTKLAPHLKTIFMIGNQNQ
ncbi:hypothetical protein [Chromobacterium sp. CV08]|uniref:hypothetical protein n=1 Tax=Chromobacterium sp. CV08 TaxID=3133274 RepID=UPI003DA8718E